LTTKRQKNITKDSPAFWILVSAINQFIAKEGKGTLPCSPAIPDMTSDSVNYVKLQQIYVARAAKDRAAVTAHVRAIQKKVGSKIVIEDEDINQFCRNFRSVALVRGRSIAQEYDAKTFQSELLNEILEEEGYEAAEPVEGDENSSIPNPKSVSWYFALRSAERFRTQHKRYPGSSQDALDKDLTELKKINAALVKETEVKVDAEEAAKCLQEVIRGAGQEVHNIAALMGGVGSQMALKLILQQYVPLNNTFVFNGVHGSAKTINL
jgi:amyloid beta precursor protein binding protein 1